MSGNWFNSFGFNPIQRTNIPGGNTPPVNQPPVNQPPAFTGGHGVDRFERRNELFAPGGGSVHELVNNVAKMPLNEAQGQLHKSTFEAMRNPNFEFPPIEG